MISILLSILLGVYLTVGMNAGLIAVAMAYEEERENGTFSASSILAYIVGTVIVSIIWFPMLVIALGRAYQEQLNEKGKE